MEFGGRQVAATTAGAGGEGICEDPSGNRNQVYMELYISPEQNAAHYYVVNGEGLSDDFRIDL